MNQWGIFLFLQTQRAEYRAVVRFVKNFINILFTICACSHTTPRRSRESPGVQLSAQKSAANVTATTRYNSLEEDKTWCEEFKTYKMAKNWRTVIVCMLQAVQTLSQIFQWLYRWMPWGPSRSPALAASWSPYLKSKQSTINLFERPLWLLMYPKLEHFTPLVPEIWW